MRMFKGKCKENSMPNERDLTISLGNHHSLRTSVKESIIPNKMERNRSKQPEK